MAISLPLVSEWNPSGINKAIADFKKLETAGQKAQFAIKKAALPAAAALAGVGALAAVSIKAGEEFATANARVQQINESMGLFGNETQKVTNRLLNLAEATARQIGVDNLSIKATQAKLLTFAELADTADEVGGNFDRATMAALDMAAAGFGAAEQNAVQLGKALNDPIKGITALARSGVTFTEQEKEKIATLVKSGKTLQAQELILQAIEKQVGGTAKATANDTDKMKESFNQFKQQLGNALLPALNKITPKLTALAAWASKNKTAFITIGAVIATIAVSVLAANAALAVWNTITAVTAALNTALGASFSALWVATGAVVILGIIAAVIALQAKFDIFGKAIDGLKTAFNAVWGVVQTVWGYIRNAFTTGFDFISTVVAGWYAGVRKYIDALYSAFKTVFNGIASLWNNTFGKLSFKIPSWVPVIGGKGFDVPDIPMLADGGIVTGPTLAMIGEAGPEAVIPLNRMGGMGGMNITVNMPAGSNGDDVVRALQEWSRRNGSLPLVTTGKVRR